MGDQYDSNFLVLDGLLVDYLNAEITECRTVSVTELKEQAIADIVREPKILVAYAGEVPAEGNPTDANYGRTQAVTQRWLTIVGVSFASLNADGTLPREKAGRLLWRVRETLQGKSFHGFRKLKNIYSPLPVYAERHALFPLAWAATMVAVGETPLR
jgi:hypothetical protein